MINTLHAAVAHATVAFSPVLGTAPFGVAPLGTHAAAAGSVAQTWIRSSAFGPIDESAYAASGSNSAQVALAPGAKAVAQAARRHRAPRASVLDSRHRLHCR
ncbi:hypothetical protein CH306_24550 [Rhodococcus sp. 15-725-2-2b]|jgi:hypothetical protein|uniref:hypothetical protein n=1 Tax=Nocardiaceae TaxID=85025 RepID=UPI00050C8755|nr:MULTISPECIES: hypothetical protein [Rhodococcus]AJW39642.1 hypothetical protein NY08_1612 [Rhodococcus sp. B7740]OZC65991.1 hypothetical protein CH276_08530 [Rhodococcus sp. 06-470-2]OZC71974.1 hypothetical protein CH277_05985 [Rhodococcus sp. 06-469-3-2]OZC82624.1 hypothetical protein CH274_06035 [Rhodococcus sp. 06-418-5]OZD39453.1 hypothetical protein CH264_27290 [Rhodococcus sp. 06-1477-1A]